MKMEGRVFVLTGPQMLEIADLLERLAPHARAAGHQWDQARPADSWALHLRREHAAHFGEEGDDEAG